MIEMPICSAAVVLVQIEFEEVEMGVKAYRGRLLVDEFDFSLDTFGASLELTVESDEAGNWQSAAAQLSRPRRRDVDDDGYYTGNDAGDIFQR